jgi:hypothetical protein
MGQLKSQVMQQQTQALQQQEAGMSIQQKQMDLDSERGFMKAYTEANGDPEKALQLAPGYGVMPTYLYKVKDMLLGYQQKEAELDKTTLENKLAHNDMLHSVYQDAFDEKDPNKQAQLAADAGREALKKGLVTPQTAFQYNGPDSLKLYEGGLNTTKYVTTRAQAQKDIAEAGQKKLQTQVEQHKLDLYNTLMQTPQALQNRVNASVDPVKYPQLNAIAMNEAKNQPDIEGINATTEKYAAKVADIEKELDPRARQAKIADEIAKETDPRLLAARTQQAVQTEAATSPFKVAQAVATARQVRAGDNPAVANVAPGAVMQVTQQAMKLDEQYAKEKAIAETMGRFLDLAASGNKAAGSNIPLLGVETLNAANGIKRVNRDEITQYEGAGSLFDRIVGKLGKLAVGQPIPQDVLNDIRTMHQTLGNQSWQTYTNSIGALNNRFNSQFQPMWAAPNVMKPGAQQLPGGTPALPASIPAQYRSTAHYSAKTKSYYYSKDGGKSWVQVPAQ